MKPEDAAIRLSLHLMQCGMMMPFEWVKENGEGSELQQAFRMALDALQENEELRKENGVVKEELERVRKAYEDLCGYIDEEGFLRKQFCENGNSDLEPRICPSLKEHPGYIDSDVCEACDHFRNSWNIQ